MSLAPVQHTAPFARLDGDARDRPLLILIWVVTAAALTLSFGFAPILDRLSTDDAMRLADGRAGALALLIAPTVGTALVHFRPGAIDHHNAQIVLLIWALALLARQRPSPSATAAAAFLSALSLAIGLETLPAIIVISAA